MDSLGLSEFFYNAIPGVLFLFTLRKLDLDGGFFRFLFTHKESTTNILWIIALGLFFGFFSQVLLKIIKMKKTVPFTKFQIFSLNDFVFRRIIRKKNKLYDSAKKKLGTLKSLDDVENLYAMDNYLRNNLQMNVTNYYAKITGFWGNVFFGLLFLLIASVWKNTMPTWQNIFLFFCLGLSILFTYVSMKAQLETTLQTFILIKKK